MRRIRVRNFALPMIPLLMGASLAAEGLYSPAYGVMLSNDYVEKLVASDIVSTTVMSTRNEKMADLLLSFDVFLTKLIGPSSFERPYYDVYFQLKETIYTDVAYANGMFNWFTEHGNVVLEQSEVRVTFPKWSENNANQGIYAPSCESKGYVNVANPALNQAYYSPIDASSAHAYAYSGRACRSTLPYVDDGEAARNNLNVISQPKTMYRSGISYSTIHSNETILKLDMLHENYPENGEILTYFGNFGFTPLLEDSSVEVRIGFESVVSIARTSQWGSCVMTGQAERKLTLPNWKR